MRQKWFWNDLLILLTYEIKYEISIVLFFSSSLSLSLPLKPASNRLHNIDCLILRFILDNDFHRFCSCLLFAAIIIKIKFISCSNFNLFRVPYKSFKFYFYLNVRELNCCVFKFLLDVSVLYVYIPVSRNNQFDCADEVSGRLGKYKGSQIDRSPVARSCETFAK